MKTFLWTTLFWIIVAIAWLLCLGFGNLGTQVLDNNRLASVMPKNLQTRICDPLVATAMEWVDRCAAAESHNCNTTEEIETGSVSETDRLKEPLSSIIANQEIIYKYIQDSFESNQQKIDALANSINQISQVDNSGWLIVDEKEQQRLQIQAQIDALQNEMANL